MRGALPRAEGGRGGGWRGGARAQSDSRALGRGGTRCAPPEVRAPTPPRAQARTHRCVGRGDGEIWKTVGRFVGSRFALGFHHQNRAGSHKNQELMGLHYRGVGKKQQGAQSILGAKRRRGAFAPVTL